MGSGASASDPMQKVSLQEKLSLFTEHWSPRVVGELNGQHVRVVKLQGDFIWHHHENEDELFLVLKGVLHLDYRENGSEKTVDLNEGEFIVMPRGVEHRPRAEEEAHVLLFEPAATLNTGNIQSDRTVAQPARV